MATLFNSLFQPQVGGSLGEAQRMQDLALRYHERTKHRLQGYAQGPEALDWDAQPDPFRSWPGAARSLLPLQAEAWPVTWRALRQGDVPPAALDRAGLALLLEMSLAITAWKQLGPDRWALRANPSSGNLHPTEAYVVAQGVPGLPDGLFHYEPCDHGLAWRAAGKLNGLPAGRKGLWLGLTSVAWREAWKYGERAFRYCQLDTGHALGAVRVAAAAMGWQARWVPNLSHEQLAALLGLDRDGDFGQAEREEPEGLVALSLSGVTASLGQASDEAHVLAQGWQSGARWMGQAARLDARPMYHWPVIDEVSHATRAQGSTASPATVVGAAKPSASRHADADRLGAPVRDQLPASRVIRERRSAQHFDRRAVMPRDVFVRLLAVLMPDNPVMPGLPWDAWPHAPRVHVVVYAHRVEGLAPGAYVLPRSQDGKDDGNALPLAPLNGGAAMMPVPGVPDALPLLRLAEHPALAGTLRTLSCHQAIGSDACVAFSLVAEFDAAIEADTAAYRALFQEAGLIGQMLYLQAEAEGFRGTGIGCYFDDAVHELLGLQGTALQVLYQFTVGQAMVDSRLQSEPPYAPARQGLDTPFDVAPSSDGYSDTGPDDTPTTTSSLHGGTPT